MVVKRPFFSVACAGNFGVGNENAQKNVDYERKLVRLSLSEIPFLRSAKSTCHFVGGTTWADVGYFSIFRVKREVPKEKTATCIEAEPFSNFGHLASPAGPWAQSVAPKRIISRRKIISTFRSKPLLLFPIPTRRKTKDRKGVR